MKTLLLISSVGALVLAGGLTAAGNVHADQADTSKAEEKVQVSESGSQGNYSDFAEFNNLKTNVDLSKYQIQVVEDNPHTRIIILRDDNGHEQFKSIFVKDTGRHKIVGYDKGLISNKILSDYNASEVNHNYYDDEDDQEEIDDEADDQEEADDQDDINDEADDQNEVEKENKVDNAVEFDIVEDQINVDEEQARVVEDNDHKRVIVIANNNGQDQYKSIFVKDTNRLKIVDYRGGLVYNDIIK